MGGKVLGNWNLDSKPSGVPMKVENHLQPGPLDTALDTGSLERTGAKR